MVAGWILVAGWWVVSAVSTSYPLWDVARIAAIIGFASFALQTVFVLGYCALAGAEVATDGS